MNAALQDLLTTYRKLPMVSYFAWSDTKARYRRSVLGPFWLTLGTAFGVLGLGFLWSTLLHLELRVFIPSLTIGLVIWQLIAGCLTESCLLLCRQLINFAHNLCIILLALLIFPPPLSAIQLLAIPGLFLVIGNLFWMTSLLSFLGIRFRDLEPFIASIMPILFFISPVIYRPNQLPLNTLMVWLNPFSYLITLIRDPLQGICPPLFIYAVASGLLVSGLGLTLGLLSNQYRHMASVIFNNVTVQYPIYHARNLSLRHQLIRLSTGGLIAQESREVVTVTALKNASFELRDGDAIGVIGHNGSGKTTLLRTISDIYSPASGQITRQGKISALLELGAGFDPELSGYENIVRMALLLGADRKSIDASIPEIESFTELGDFLKLPVSTYSSGMLMRLMFAVSTSIQPEILVVDEIWGTGDAAFQTKSERRMKELLHKAKIFVLSSHSTQLIEQHCNRIFRLEHGTLSEITK
ncbi:MAG: ATP-binding cassette domain-containing protein [Pseudomonadota bacterium]